MFVPFVNFVMPIILGLKGYEWAWKNKKWDNEEQFLKNQKDWTKWGLIVVGGMALFFTITFTTVFGAIGKNEPMSTAIAIIQEDPKCIEVLGEDIKKGFGWTGSINTSGTSGSADISFTMKGSKSSAKCYLKAHKDLGDWKIDLLLAKDKETEENILLIDNR